MENIKILKNIPEALLDEFKNFYELKFKGKAPQDKWSAHHLASILEGNDVEHFGKFLPLPPAGIEIYYATGMIMPHIDRGRKTALQIPIDVDTGKMFIYSAKSTDLSKLQPRVADFLARKISANVNVVNNPEHWFYEWDPETYDTYNFELPALQNVSLPHGGANYSKNYGIFFSISYKTDYNEVCSRFSSWQ